MKKKVLILGINGQDGSFLAEILLKKNYEVHGLIRHTSTNNLLNINHILDKITLHYGDLTEPISLTKVIKEVNPKEIYNEADQDHAGISFDIPSYNFDLTGAAVGKILEIIRLNNPKIKFFQPVTSNMYGIVKESPQNENTKFNPLTPYACSKVFAYHLCQMYRVVYGLYVCIGIFYNHESERRSDKYVTRKITKSIARIKLGKQKNLVLGDLKANIDWGHSKEYMEAAWSIMQQPKPENFIIGSGQTHSVQEFLEEVCKLAKINSKKYVKTSKKLLRPAKNSKLVADITKAKKVFNFNPKINMKKLAKMMYNNDLKKEKQSLS